MSPRGFRCSPPLLRCSCALCCASRTAARGWRSAWRWRSRPRGAIWLAIPGGGSRFPASAGRVLLAFFPAVFVAALLFARQRLRRFGAALWLDAAIGAIGAAAIVTQLLGETADRATGGGWASVVALAYPMFDVLLVVMVLVAVTLRGWRVSFVWMLLAAGLLAHVVADVGYVSSGLVDERRAAVGAGARPALAAADRRRRVEPGAPPRKVVLDGWRTLVTPDGARARRRRPAGARPLQPHDRRRGLPRRRRRSCSCSCGWR